MGSLITMVEDDKDNYRYFCELIDIKYDDSKVYKDINFWEWKKSDDSKNFIKHLKLKLDRNKKIKKILSNNNEL